MLVMNVKLFLLILLMLTTVNFEFVRCVRSSLAYAVVSKDLSLADLE